MPTYDYQCDACGHEFELFQNINDAPKRKCPECGRRKLRRLFGTGAALVFKGSGFYQTDYRSESYKKAAAADKKSADKKSADKKSADKKSADKKSAGSGSGASGSQDSKSSDSTGKSKSPS